MVGALANEILRLYLVAVGQQHGPFIPTDASGYAISTVLYVGLAGAVTFLWDDPNPIKCFAIGVGLPRIIQSITQTGVPPKTSSMPSIEALWTSLSNIVPARSSSDGGIVNPGQGCTRQTRPPPSLRFLALDIFFTSVSRRLADDRSRYSSA